MGYVLRVRFASFFAGAAVASSAGFYFLHKDYKMAHESMSKQMNDLYKYLDGRISSLENLKEIEALKPVEDAE
nr:pre-mRNA-splicing factor 38A like [Tanacetum cinerariifolium]